ncbi:phenylalanine--tRNA ligase subunit alpha [Candidatus Micrarchaeota archaeon]|nr:phenylalanine--tRNA ligase subunit alpha [Candidatus Micrarchaeota archaeon]
MNLTNQEKKVLLSLQKNGRQTTNELVKNTSLTEAGVNRAVAWLTEKKLCSVEERSTERVTLDEEGVNYHSNGLPERILLNDIKDSPKSIRELAKKHGEDAVKIGTVWLRKMNAAMILSGNVQITPDGKKLLDKKTPHEEILSLIHAEKSVPKELTGELDSLKKRGKILKVSEVKHRTITITKEGKEEKNIKVEDEISTITPEIIRSGDWKNKKIRKYDVSAPVPTINPGKKQLYYEFLDEVREKMIAMGFKEMRGNFVQPEFWNFDALVLPQTHPTRSEHDTYYLKSPKQGDILDKELEERVKNVHSRLWKYDWEETKAKNLILQSHTTHMSARYLLNDKNYPLRYFSIERIARRDVIDATHLPEFHHMEGIVADESLTLRDLLGMLKSFATEIGGIKETKFKCAYFPYTEPSVELFAKHPTIGWTELGGAGMFRPEVLEIVGTDVPVIAWGMGIDRIAMFSLGIKNIRDLFSNDLKFLQQHA